VVSAGLEMPGELDVLEVFVFEVRILLEVLMEFGFARQVSVLMSWILVPME
jgi:hypothetical protein